jgi:hypothetical protein
MAETCSQGMTVVFARHMAAIDQSIKAMPLTTMANPATLEAAPPGIVHGRHCCSAQDSAKGTK